MLKVLEHILMSRSVEQLQYTAYTEAVKELLTDGIYELQRLATKMPDQLLVRLSFPKGRYETDESLRMFMISSRPRSMK
jgi:hypothetical protein